MKAVKAQLSSAWFAAACVRAHTLMAASRQREPSSLEPADDVRALEPERRPLHGARAATQLDEAQPGARVRGQAHQGADDEAFLH